MNRPYSAPLHKRGGTPCVHGSTGSPRTELLFSVRPEPGLSIAEGPVEGLAMALKRLCEEPQATKQFLQIPLNPPLKKGEELPFAKGGDLSPPFGKGRLGGIY